jgi:hypothetical protein
MFQSNSPDNRAALRNVPADADPLFEFEVDTKKYEVRSEASAARKTHAIRQPISTMSGAARAHMLP